MLQCVLVVTIISVNRFMVMFFLIYMLKSTHISVTSTDCSSVQFLVSSRQAVNLYTLQSTVVYCVKREFRNLIENKQR